MTWTKIDSTKLPARIPKARKVFFQINAHLTFLSNHLRFLSTHLTFLSTHLGFLSTHSRTTMPTFKSKMIFPYRKSLAWHHWLWCRWLKLETRVFGFEEIYWVSSQTNILVPGMMTRVSLSLKEFSWPLTLVKCECSGPWALFNFYCTIFQHGKLGERPWRITHQTNLASRWTFVWILFSVVSWRDSAWSEIVKRSYSYFRELLNLCRIVDVVLIYVAIIYMLF